MSHHTLVVPLARNHPALHLPVYFIYVYDEPGVGVQDLTLFILGPTLYHINIMLLYRGKGACTAESETVLPVNAIIMMHYIIY